MLKKNLGIVILAVLISFIFGTVVFAEDEWVPFEAGQENVQPMECTIVKPIGPNENITAALPPITDEDWSIGPKDAPLTILEYSDFQCPYCSNAGLALLEFQKNHPDEVRYVYRHFPLSFHEKAPMAAYAADAAGAQGLFFEAEHLLYSTQSDWSGLESLDAFETWLKDNFKTQISGLNYDQWLTDFADPDLRAKIDKAFDEVVATGVVSGTPTIFLNFNSYQGSYDEAALTSYLKFFELQGKAFQECPPNLIDVNKDYRAVLDTTKGKITVDLYTEQAPLAVNNFIFLATQGWFDGIPFYKVVPGFIVQSGDPSGSGMGNPGYQFVNEKHDLKFGDPGVVGMANSGKDKNGSQFFITFNLHDYYQQSIKEANDKLTSENKLTDEMIEKEVQDQLNKMSDSYTVFGKVSEGYDVAQTLTTSDSILSVTIEEKAK